MTNEQKLNWLSGLLIYLPITGGANLLLFLLGKMAHRPMRVEAVDYLITNGSIIGGLMIGYLLIRWRVSRKEKAPIADERTINLLKNYFLIAIYIIFILSGILLLTLFFLGIESIEIGWIFVYLSMLILLTIIGGLIVSRR